MGLLRVILNHGGWVDIVSCLISCTVVVFLVMPIHEYAHGFMAHKLGDPTPRWQGRMTLNPMAHIDYMGAIMIYLVGFGWAKPVNVDSRYFNKPKRDMALTALAGPASNLLFALLSLLVMNIVNFIGIKVGAFGIEPYGLSYYSDNYLSIVLMIVRNIFSFIGLINISLAVFNLIPIPPLDGSKILFAILPDRIYWKIMRYERLLYFALIFLIFFGNGFSSALSNIVYTVVDWFTELTWLPFDFFV